MKNLIFVLLALCSSAALAGSESMVAQCEAVMRCDVCRITNDTQARPNGYLVTVKGEVAARRIPESDYNWLRNAGAAKGASGRYLMCERVEEAMKQPASSRGFMARSMFDADWKEQTYCP